MDLTEEIQPNKISSIYIGGSPDRKVDFKVGNKARVAIRNRGIEWDVFKKHIATLTVEERNDAVTEFVSRFFNLRDDMTLMKYASLPTNEIVQSLRKQLFIHEPLALSIREVFFKLVHLYENMLRKLVPEDEWTKLETAWNENDPEETSSKPLWNLTRDKAFADAIITSHPELREWLNMKFSYKGFCPKVPGVRLGILLEFPVHALIQIMKWENEDSVINKISKSVCELLRAVSGAINVVEAVSSIALDSISDESVESIEVLILNEQKLLPVLEMLEAHYIEKAELMNSIVLAISSAMS